MYIKKLTQARGHLCVYCIDFQEQKCVYFNNTQYTQIL